MTATQREKEIYGSGVEIVERGTDYTVYQLSDKTGTATMTCYQVFSGMELIYNDVHMEFCRVEASPPQNILEINHCREGRIECEMKNEYFFLAQGDLSIHLKNQRNYSSYFPLKHYHGISITIDLDTAPSCLSCILESVDVTPAQLKQKFCDKADFAVLRGQPCFEHIFSELYCVPASIRTGYLKIKVMELLLFLSGAKFEPGSALADRRFNKSQVDMAKDLKRYLIEHTERHETIEELANRYHVSSTTLKACFKGVFGTSIYAFWKSFKMQKAAEFLKETDKTVIEIAGMLGYDNGSKFAKAFRDFAGVSPREYRQSCPNGAEPGTNGADSLHQVIYTIT